MGLLAWLRGRRYPSVPEPPSPPEVWRFVVHPGEGQPIQVTGSLAVATPIDIITSQVVIHGTLVEAIGLDDGAWAFTVELTQRQALEIRAVMEEYEVPGIEG